MYAIRKPCWCHIKTSLFGIPKIFKVDRIDYENSEITIEGHGEWDLDRFIIIKTLKRANKIINILKELQNEKN